MNCETARPKGLASIRFLDSLNIRVLLLVLALTPPMVICYHRVQMDDPFITYRYARNLSEGRGFLYNPGEQVLGTTAPLYALMLALMGRLSDNYPLLSSTVSGIALGISSLLVYRILAALKQAAAGGIAAVLVVLNPLLGDALGFELNLFLALILGAYAAAFSDRPNLAAFLLALGTLTRGDGLVPAGLILSYEVWKHRHRAWMPLLIYGAVVGGWAAYAIWTFGSPFPNTLAVKRAMGESGLWRPYWHGALRVGYLYLKQTPLYLWFVVVGVLGCAKLFKIDRRIYLIVGWTGLVFVAYTAMGIPEGFNYYAGMVPVLMVVSGLGVVHLTDRIVAQWPTWCRGWAVAGVLIPLLAALLVPTLREIGEQPEPRHPAYRTVGKWLASETPHDASVGLVEIGIVGYYSNRRVVDVCGLITPGVGPHMASGDIAWPIRTHRPDYVLLHDPLWTSLEGPIASAAWFQEGYERVRTFDADEPYRLALYRRKKG